MKQLSYLIVAGLAALAAGAVAAQTAEPPDPGHSSKQVDLDSHTLLGQVALEQGRRQDAAKEFLQAAQLSDDPGLASQTARMAYELGLTDMGLTATKRWQTLRPMDSRAHWFAGIFQLRLGNVDAAVGEFSTFVKAVGEPESGLSLVVDALTSEPNATGAMQIMQALVKQFPGTAEGDYGLAQLAMSSGDFALALEHVKSATEEKPDWLDAELLYARALLVSGQSQQGLALMAKLAKEHEDVPVQLQYAELLLSAGQTDQAHALLDKILAAHPGLPEASRALAFLALSENDLDTAENLFRDLSNQDRFRDEAFYYLGRIAEKRDQPLQATRNYSRVTQGSHAVEAQARTAEIMLKSMHNGDGALRHLQEFGEANPRFETPMLVARSQLLVEMKRPEDALSLLNSALSDNPQDAGLQEAHAQLYVALAQDAEQRHAYDEAQHYIDEGLERHPNHRSLLYSEALLLQDRGDIQKSAQVLEGLAKNYPDDPTVLNALGYLLTDQFDRYQEARGYIQKALAKEPDNPAIIDSMGWVLYKLGDYKSAYDYLDRAYKLYADPEVASHLINVQWALGHKTEALDLLHAALAKDPDDARLKELSHRLEQ
ncbi:MAG TPA: tetratricopeptide repeat protein [Gammaproteobacteria bacterium]|nr:tetratricopeptide repeat protein [Gammaproteobacteria bacterium]